MRSRIVLGLTALYALIRLPLVLAPIPGWYRGGVQSISFSVAVSTAKHGIPPELVMRQSFSGANLHGMLGAPIPYLGLDVRFVRLVMLIAGLITVALFVVILRRLDTSEWSIVMAAVLLILTPHFVLFTGFATSVAVEICFGVASVYAYLQYLSGSKTTWAVASGLFAGLATLNHFWGGIVTVTIFTFDALVIGVISSETGRSKAVTVLVSRLKLWITHILSLLPAAALYIYYDTRLTGQAKQIFEHYGAEYTIWETGYVLLTSGFYTRIGYWAIQYLPVFLVALPIITVAVIRRFSTAPLSDFIREYDDSIGPAPLAFWAIWLVCGVGVLIILPQGAIIHDYYLWWVLLPSVGGIAWWTDNRGLLSQVSSINRNQLRNLGVVLLAVLFLTSSLLSGYHVAREPIDGRDLPMAGNADGSIPGHADKLTPVLQQHITETDNVLLHGNTVSRVAAIRTGFVEISRVNYIKGSITSEQLAGRTVVVSTEDLSSRLGDDWQLVESVEAAGYTSRIYRNSNV